MATLRCTKKLLAELKIKPSDDVQPPSDFSSWHANLLRIERRKCVLFTHDQSLYTFFIPGLKKLHFQRFDEIFQQNLFKNLVEEELPQKHIEMFLDDTQEIKICKTSNRSVLGSMNDLAFQLQWYIADEGGLEYTDILKLNHDLKRIPMSAIKEIYSIRELKRVLEKRDR